MARTLDLDKKEHDWREAITKFKGKVQALDRTIEKTQTEKQEAIEQIEKYKRWIHTAREMYGLNTTDLEETTVAKTEKEGDILLLPKKTRRTNMPQAIARILSEAPEKGLTTTEVTKKLEEGKFPTTAKNFRNVVFTQLYMLSKEGKFIVKKIGKENYYRLKK